ncbi:m024L [Myxoma virus]|uniref:M024L n=1 Tax=Myxoma virus TaxID=10273 RepID=A0A481NE00_9POXV|nr:m024L [Myxoma virus]
MNVSTLDDVLKLNPFKHMNRIKINREEKCLLGSTSFIKIDKVKHIPGNAVNVSKSIHVRGQDFTLSELLYSPLYFQQARGQCIMPHFVLKCIDEAKKNRMVCKYCTVTKSSDPQGLNANIFIPTKTESTYIIIGIRIKSYWSVTFRVE